MELSLDTFAASDFDVKAWLNDQFAGLDASDSNQQGTKAEKLAQRLTTQLHFLATNAQQGNERIKARFQHQAAQITRDIASLSKLVQETQSSLDAFSTVADHQKSSSEGTMERVVEIGTAKRQMEKTVAALDYLHDYNSLPQKVEALIKEGDLVKAWEMVDSVSRSAQDNPNMALEQKGIETILSKDDIKNYEKQVCQATIKRLTEEIASHEAGSVAETSSLLLSHGHGDEVGSIYLTQRTKDGIEHLKSTKDDGSTMLNHFVDLISQEHKFLEAAGIQPSKDLLESLLDSLIEQVVQPCIQKMFNKEEESEEVDRYIEQCEMVTKFSVLLYEILLQSSRSLSVGSDNVSTDMQSMLSRPVPQWLKSIYDPIVEPISSLVNIDVAHIRQNSLARLQSLESPKYRHMESYIRDASEVMESIFAELDQVLQRSFAYTPLSRFPEGIATVSEIVADMAVCFTDQLGQIAKQIGLGSAAEFSGYAHLAEKSTNSNIFSQNLANEDKFGSVSGIVSMSLLSRILDNHTQSLATAISERWEALLRDRSIAATFVGTATAGEDITPERSVRLMAEAVMESCRSPSDLVNKIWNPLISNDQQQIQMKPVTAELLQSVSNSVVYALVGVFRPALSRIPRLEAWHTEANTKSSMNVEVPQFSCSPSEEAVEIGEKMHMLLPELEQIEAMDLQSMRNCFSNIAVPSLYQFTLQWQLSPKDGLLDDVEPLASVMTMMLKTILRCFAQQISCIEMPSLSSHGQQQLVADVEYLASVASSFTSESDPVFDQLRRMLNGNTDLSELPLHESNTQRQQQRQMVELLTKMKQLLNK